MSKPVAVAWAATAEELERQYRGERGVERRKRRCGWDWLAAALDARPAA